MTDPPEQRIQVFTMFTGDTPVSLWLPQARARAVDGVAVLPAGLAGGVGRPSWQPLRVVDAAWDTAADGADIEPLMTFPYADELARIGAARTGRWNAQPGVPLPDEGWHALDEGWWAWLVVRDGWVFGAQTEFDAALDALAAQATVTWVGAGRAQLGDAPVSWFRVRRAAWDDAWRLAVEQVHRPQA